MLVWRREKIWSAEEQPVGQGCFVEPHDCDIMQDVKASQKREENCV